MKKFKISTLFIVSFLIVFSSCSVDKKMYSSGYHVEWYKNSIASQKQKTAIAAKTPKEKNSLNQKNIFPEPFITKEKNKKSNSFLLAKNSISKIYLLEKNIFEQAKILRVDSLKSNQQKIFYLNDDVHKDRSKNSGLGIASIMLGILFLLLDWSSLSAGTGIPLLFIAFFLIIAGIVLLNGNPKNHYSDEEKLQRKAENKLLAKKIGKGALLILLGILLLFLYVFIMWCLIFDLPSTTLEVGVVFLLFLAAIIIYSISCLSRRIKKESLFNQ